MIRTTQAMKAYMRGDVEVIDMQGKTIIPGFNDSHVHFLKGGQGSRYIDLSRTRSHADIINLSKEFIIKNYVPAGEWLMGRGWDENYLLEKEIPDRNVLDQISTEHPIAFTRSCEHAVAANSKAIEIAGVSPNTPHPKGGEWCKFPDGSPNGLFKDIARDMIYDQIEEPDKEAIKSSLKEAIAMALENGITSIQTDDFWTIPSKNYKKIIEAYEELESEGELKIRIYEQCVLETFDAFEK